MTSTRWPSRSTASTRCSYPLVVAAKPPGIKLGILDNAGLPKTHEKAIRVISIERGHDPRQFTLVAFGGGGPLHACSLARALRIPTVLIPAMPGALSAVGILLADTVRDYSRTVMLPCEAIENLRDGFAELEDRGRAE